MQFMTNGITEESQAGSNKAHRSGHFGKRQFLLQFLNAYVTR